MKKIVERVGDVERSVLEGTPEEIAAYERAIGKLDPVITIKSVPSTEQQFPVIPDWFPPCAWATSTDSQQPCAFDGLPDGAYGLVCSCPRCTPQC